MIFISDNTFQKNVDKDLLEHVTFVSSVVSKNLFKDKDSNVKINFYNTILPESHEIRGMFQQGEIFLATDIISEDIKRMNIPEKVYLTFLVVHELVHKYQIEVKNKKIVGTLDNNNYAKCRFERAANLTAMQLAKTIHPEVDFWIELNGNKYTTPRWSKYVL